MRSRKRSVTHLLDSGALYRATALAALEKGVSADDERALAALAENLDLRFDDGDRTHLSGADVTDRLRLEEVGALASEDFRAAGGTPPALRALQLSFRRLPGLVADGARHGHRDLPRRRP